MPDIADYIRQSKAATGRLPKLREINEHNGGRLLDTLLQLMELDEATKAEIRRQSREERRSQK